MPQSQFTELSQKSNDPIGVRNFIQAPENHLILSLDFSQIELRVGAFYCRDKTMMETYQDGGIFMRQPLRHFWLYLCRSTKQASTGIQGTAYHRQERELWHILRAISKGTAEHIEVQGRRREIYTGM